MRRLFRLTTISMLAASTSLGGCMLGPDFSPPAAPRTDTYGPEPQKPELVGAGISGGEAQRIVRDLDIPGQWWSVFQSRPLNGLIDQALHANPDIDAAKAALRVAQFNARVQRSTLFPTVQAGFSGTHNQIPGPVQDAASPAPAEVETGDGGNSAGSPPTPTYITYGLFTAGFTISYALDVFGANRRSIESAEALAEAQCFQLEGAYLSLASNVVVAAITEASLRAQVDATRRIIAAQRETLGILQQQSTLGAIPGADVASQQAALAQAEATLPPLEKALVQQRNLLATLTGRLPSDALSERFELSDLKLPGSLPLSLPAKLVEQRPDVRAAEAQLHSASALVGVAIANQFPDITLSAGYGTQAIASNLLFGPGTIAANVGVNVLQTLIDGGALSAKKKAAKAAFDQANAEYRSIVLTAFRNVADTLTALEYDAITLRAAVEAERAAATSLTIARRRLELGDTTYVLVLIAELTYQQAMLSRVQAQAARLTNTAALFQALGGGWWNRDGASDRTRRMACRAPAPTQEARTSGPAR